MIGQIENMLPHISAVFGSALMLVLLVILLLRYFGTIFAPSSTLGQKLAGGPAGKKAAGSWRDALLCSVLWFAVSRVFVFVVALLYARLAGYDWYLTNMPSHWVKWDAPHYIGLIENWYVNEGDPRFHIVFFPMYPLVCRMLLPLFQGNAELSAFVVSNLCGIAAGAFLYRLAALDFGRGAAGRATKFLFLNPLSFFLSLPYTESLFLLLTVAAVYLARRRKYALALLCGAMCAACRLMGIVVAIPIFYSMLSQDKEEGRLGARRVLLRVLACCAVLVGVAAYLLLNWRVTGNPFQFWIYQEEHWHNTTGTLWNTFDYIVRYALMHDPNMQWGTWIPTIAALYGAIVLLCVRWRKMNPGDAAYGWAYMYMSIVPTWLISGPRYVSGMYCLYPALGSWTKKRSLDVALSVLSTLALGFMACMFVFRHGVY